MYLAIAQANLVSKVERGENAGRTLRHAPVARSIEQIGSVEKKGSLLAWADDAGGLRHD